MSSHDRNESFLPETHVNHKQTQKKVCHNAGPLNIMHRRAHIGIVLHLVSRMLLLWNIDVQYEHLSKKLMPSGHSSNRQTSSSRDISEEGRNRSSESRSLKQGCWPFRQRCECQSSATSTRHTWLRYFIASLLTIWTTIWSIFPSEYFSWHFSFQSQTIDIWLCIQLYILRGNLCHETCWTMTHLTDHPKLSEMLQRILASSYMHRRHRSFECFPQSNDKAIEFSPQSLARDRLSTDGILAHTLTTVSTLGQPE